MTNPYLAANANAITQQTTQNLQNNVLPGINSGAMAAGGFGGSRQAIAQGLAIGQTNQGLSNSLAGMYGQAYDGDQNRANQMGMATMQNQTARDLGFGGLQNQRYGMDQNFQLGQQNANTNQYQAQTSRDLGQGQNANQAQSIANQNQQAQGQLGLGYQQAGNAYSLGQQANANNAQANANQYSLGQGQNTNQANSISNQYNLGMGQLGLGAQTANQNFFTQQRGQDYQGMQLGMQMANMGNQGLANQGGQLYNAGQQQQNAPWQNLQNFQNSLAPFTGLNGSSSTSNPGFSGLQGAMAGGMTAAQLWAMLSGGQQRPGG